MILGCFTSMSREVTSSSYCMTGNLEFHELSALPIIELKNDAPSHLAIVIKLPTLPPLQSIIHTKCGLEKCACKDFFSTHVRMFG